MKFLGVYGQIRYFFSNLMAKNRIQILNGICYVLTSKILCWQSIKFLGVVFHLQHQALKGGFDEKGVNAYSSS